jgi:hypothetical protein
VIASALGHDYENETFTATCLAKGFTMHTCTRCQHSYNDGFSEKTDHSASDWIIDVSPTVGASGSEHTKCIFCHVVLERRDIAPLVSDSDTLPDTEVNENGENEKKEMKAWEIALVSFGGTSGAIGVFGGSFLLIRRRIRRRAIR